MKNRLNSRSMTFREKRVEGAMYGMTIFDTLKAISAGTRRYFFNKLMAPLLLKCREEAHPVDRHRLVCVPPTFAAAR